MTDVRIGMSWPAGHGRRRWVSMSPGGWLAYGVFWVLLVAPIWIAAWSVWGSFLVGRATVRGLAAIHRDHQARRLAVKGAP